MVRRKLDGRIKTLIENGVIEGHRSMFVIVGDYGRDQVPILHHILSKASYKPRPSVLWCYKKDLGFSTHTKKRMRKIQKRMKVEKELNEEDSFELFVASTQIRYCYYSETHKILGNTFGMCILQDFEALTPNLLARTIETVEGGGLILCLLKSVESLKQLYTMVMDVHSRYRTESHGEVVGRFNERFILSLGSCPACLVLDHQLNILPISSHARNMHPLPLKNRDELSPNEVELKELKKQLAESQPLGSLVEKCRSLDQGKCLLKLLDLVTDKSLKATVSLTAARGRGKSAALGLAVAGAVGFGYSNMFVTAPSPENLKTLFGFLLKGFDALDYQEHLDYELVQSTNPEFHGAVIRVNIFREHRQTVQYVHPGDAAKLGQAELLVVDEAAAIPLPLVRSLLGPYLIFLSSTINGYEGTGRSLSLKLIQQLRVQTAPSGGKQDNTKQLQSFAGRSLTELELEESIRYRAGDPVEQWLNHLLCLDATLKMGSGCPAPQDCELYYINRDTLFCYHKASEVFLQRLMSIYVAAHYKNSPNDLQLLSDAPAHHLFCLLGPRPNPSAIPEVLVVLQVCLEGAISHQRLVEGLRRGKRASGDLIPWTLSQQFQDEDFGCLSGGRIIRVATHPDYQGMGYGSRALHLLQLYYENKLPDLHEDGQERNQEQEEIDQEEEMMEGVDLLTEEVKPREKLPPLLSRLWERPPESLQYLGVSYGLTEQLLKFWRRAGYLPVYLRQTPNDLTGEHSCIMLKRLDIDEESPDWLAGYWRDFQKRLLNLLGYQFRAFPASLPLALLQKKAQVSKELKALSREELAIHLSDRDLKRLELYSEKKVDHHLITDLLPTLARLYFLGRLPEVKLSELQRSILVAKGLQFKDVEDLKKELGGKGVGIEIHQLLGEFNRAITQMVKTLNGICERAIEAESGVKKTKVLAKPTDKSLKEDLEEAAKEVEKEQKRQKKLMEASELQEFTIRGAEDDWDEALAAKANPASGISVKRIQKRVGSLPEADFLEKKKKKKWKSMKL